ncbi:hypothetical protein [Corynebacterium atrinae]|uniref:hypothetical protein n=1 Tax=Corynebacterium atrinae TaxID=1336740 RepID=UPI0025B534F1|nr:hypothetical protein [Corynebacterium atrinae]
MVTAGTADTAAVPAEIRGPDSGDREVPEVLEGPGAVPVRRNGSAEPPALVVGDPRLHDFTDGRRGNAGDVVEPFAEGFSVLLDDRLF